MNDELNRYLRARMMATGTAITELGDELAEAENRGEWIDGDDALRDNLGIAIGKFEAYADVLRFMNDGATDGGN